MKKSDLFNLIKKTVKEEKSKRKKIREARKERRKKAVFSDEPRLDADGREIPAITDPETPSDLAIASADDLIRTPIDDPDLGNVVQTPTAVGCAFDEVVGAVAPAGYYGDLRLWAGNCDSGNSFGLYEDLNDGWICCSENNPENPFGSGNHLYVDTNWGAWDVLDGLTISAGSAQCHCPYPIIEEINGSDYIINCDDDGDEDIVTMAQLDAFFSFNSKPLLNSYTSFGNTTSGVNNHDGSHCAGCPHDASEGCTNAYTRVDGSVGDATNILGCPDATGNVSAGGLNDISCCNFDVTCATPSTTVYNDGDLGSGGTAIPGVPSINQSSVTAPGGATVTADVNSTDANFTETGICQYPGCNEDGSSGPNSTNYTTIVYAGNDVSGPTYIVDSSPGQAGAGLGNDVTCIPSVFGCQDDGGPTNTDVFNDGSNVVGTFATPANPGVAACNYNPAATSDPNDECDFQICAGCLDGDTNENQPGYADPALRPVGFTGAACNYDPSNEISDPAACLYDFCVGCMDNGDGTNDGTQRGNYPMFTANVPACNYNIDLNDNPVTFTNHDADACEYTTCVGCMNPDACDNLVNGVPANLSVPFNAGFCNWDCYGCTTPGMNGETGGLPTSIYNAQYTQDSGLNAGPPVSPTGVSPCVFEGCLEATDANGTPHSNYVCVIANGAMCEVGGSQCSGPGGCPNGIPADGTGPWSSVNGAVGTFVDAGGCTSAEVLGCTDPLDCNYYDLATPGNSADQTVGAGYCTGQKQDCVDCVVDGTTGLDTPGDPVNDYSDECGCIDQSACNYSSTASTDLTVNLYNQNDCEIPGDCEICGTNQNVIADPQCTGCTSPTACNYGWYTSNGQLNVDPNGPIILGTTGVTDDGSCVEPAGCNMCINNVQPATTYDPAVGWTELDPSCDGCAVQGSCNYDPSASDDPAVNPQWQSSCITPTDCLLCDPAHTVGPTYPSNASLVQNPACDCATVIAHECNNEQNVRTVYCMTIDGDPNVQVNDAFILKYKVGPMAEGKTPLLTVVEQSKGPGMGIKNDPKGGDGLNLAIDDVVGPAEPYNAGAKTFVVMSVGMTNGPALPKDYDSADCVDRNYKCTMVGNSPGHSICMSTFDPLQAGVVFATKQQCIASGCHDAHWSIDLQVQHASDGQGQSEIEACDNDTINPCSQGHSYNLSWPPFGFPMSDGTVQVQAGCAYQYQEGSGCWNLLGQAQSNLGLEENIKEINDSKKLRNAFKNEFINSSKSDKEAKLREAIRKIIKNKKK